MEQGLKLLFTHTGNHLKSLFDQHTHKQNSFHLPADLHNHIQTACIHEFFSWLWAGTAVTQTNNTVLLPIDMKVSLFCILSVLFGLRAVYVFAAVWIIAFWISSSDKPTQLFRCSYARFIIQSQIVAFGLLASWK